MTEFYKAVDNGYIIGVGTNGNDSAAAITEAEYNEILSAIQTAPVAPDGYVYKLRADTLEWELVELPPVEDEELSDSEALDIILGGEEA